MEKTKNEETNQTAEKLNDLPVSPDAAEDAKGGGINYTKIEFSNTPMKEER